MLTKDLLTLNSIKKNRINVIPSQITFEITKRCNLHCSHCYLEHRTEEESLSTEKMKSIIDEVCDMGTLSANFTGGEMMLRKDWVEIVEHAKMRGLFYSFQTNGTFVSKYIDEIVRLNPTKVDISIHGSTAATHEAVSGVKGSFQKAITALKLLKKKAIRTSVKASIMKSNFADLDALEMLAKGYGAMFHCDFTVFQGLYGSVKMKEYGLSDAEIMKFFQLRGWKIRKDNEIALSERLFCNAGKLRCFVSAEGIVYPCAIWRQALGDLKKDSFSDIWNGNEIRSLREAKVADLTECNQCSLSTNCGRCPGAAWQESNNALAPSLESCRISKLLMEVNT